MNYLIVFKYRGDQQLFYGIPSHNFGQIGLNIDIKLNTFFTKLQF